MPDVVENHSRPARKTTISLQTSVVAAVVLGVMIALSLISSSDMITGTRFGLACRPPTISSYSTGNENGWLDTNVSAASQGKLWKPAIFRKFPDLQRVFNVHAPILPTTPARTDVPGLFCDNWSIVTTIFEPTHLLHQLRNLSSWCLVVVGDRKTNHTAWRDFVKPAREKVVYLSEDDQKQLPYKISSIMPWDHFGRKNVGYLYAIHHGAQLIWDTDDDNVLKNPAEFTAFVDRVARNRDKLSVVPNTHHLWNPYPHFKPVLPETASSQDIAWPRGFPLTFVRDTHTASSKSNDRANFTTVRPHQAGVYQSLADNDPDVDALYRLTRHTPLSFLPDDKREVMVLPLGRVAPFNAQATLWLKPAFWGLLLPVTVHGRVTDIWRSYIVQRLMLFQNLHLAFVSPLAIQFRNVHSLVADLQSEVPLYTQADELVRWLQKWMPKIEVENTKRTPTKYFFAVVEQLFIDLFEIGVLEEQDVELVQAWLQDLLTFGYDYEVSSINQKDNKNAYIENLHEPSVAHVANVAVCMFDRGTGFQPHLAGKSEDRLRQQLRSPEKFRSAEHKGVRGVQENIISRFGGNSSDVFVFANEKLGLCSNLSLDSFGVSACREFIVGDNHLGEPFQTSRLTGNDISANHTASPQVKYLQMFAACEKEISKRSIETNREYDWVVSMGTDDHVLSIVSKTELTMSTTSPTIWYGSTNVCCCENIWHFAVGRRVWMREYLNYFWTQEAHMQNTSGRWPTEQATRTLQNYLSGMGVGIKEHVGIRHCT